MNPSVRGAFPVCSFPHFSRVIPFVLGTSVLLSALGAFATEGRAQTSDLPEAAPQLAGPQAIVDDRQEQADDIADDPQTIVEQALINQQNFDGDLRAQALAAQRDGDLRDDGRIIDGDDNARLPVEFDLLPRAATPSLRAIQRRLERRSFSTDLYGTDYEPLGIRVGSFVLRPEITSGVLLTDNVFLTQNEQSSDEALELRGRVDLNSDWSRHAISLSASGLTSSYKQFSSENDTAYELRGRGRLDVSRRTRLDVEGFSIFGQESRNSIEFGGDAGGRPDQRQDGLVVGGQHRFNRLEIGLRGGFTNNQFEADERDYLERTLTLRAGYDVRAGLTLLADATLRDQNYELARDLAGIARSSDGFEVRGGLRFDNGSKLRGTLLAGYREQSPEDTRLEKVSGAIVDAEIDWQISALTDLRLEASSGIDGTTFGLASGVFDRDLRVRLNHAFLRNLRVSLGAEASWRDYQGIDLTERELTGIVEGEWLLNRMFSLNARYEHRDFSSSDSGRDYTENRGTIGLRLRR